MELAQAIFFLFAIPIFSLFLMIAVDFLLSIGKVEKD